MGNQAAVLICRFLAVTLGVPTQQMNIPFRCIPRLTLAAIVLVAVTACGGGGSAPPPPPPPPPMYSIGGTVSGLDAGQSVVVQLNGGNDQTVNGNVAFTFASKVTKGGTYTVTVSALSPGQTCMVTSGSGTASGNVASVAVACIVNPPFSVGGTVSGLVGQGLELALQVVSFNYNCYPCIHFESVETVAIDKNGAFVFATHLPSQTYRVSIQQQPQFPQQRCAVKNDLGVGTADVTNVELVCGQFAYVTSTTDKTISGFGIDAASGALVSANALVTGGLSPYSIANTPDKGYVYIGNSDSNDVSVFAVDSSNGALAAVPGSPFAAGTNPRSLAVVSSIGLTSTYRFFSYSYLYVANAGSNSLSAYKIDQLTGVPTPLSPASYATGAGPSAIASPGTSSRLLYVANAGGSNDISGFQVTDYSGSLTPLVGSPFPSGTNVSSMAFGAGYLFLYAGDASGGTAAIMGYSVDQSTGALTSLAAFPHPLPFCTFIVADHTGKYLYATTGTDFLGYSIDATTGALTALPGFPIAVGASVRSVSIDPTNQFLYVASGSAGTVTSYTLNAATGALTLMPGSPLAVGGSADYIATF